MTNEANLLDGYQWDTAQVGEKHKEVISILKACTREVAKAKDLPIYVNLKVEDFAVRRQVEIQLALKNWTVEWQDTNPVGPPRLNLWPIYP